MIRILIVDDQKTVRESLKALLKLTPDLQVIGTADNGQEAIAKVGRLFPDVVLVDMEMPGLDGTATTKIICQNFPGVRVIVLSMHDEDYYVAQAVKAGAMGYLIKNTPAHELAEAIRTVHKGYAQIGPGLLNKIITVNAQPLMLESKQITAPEQPSRSRLNQLSPSPFILLGQKKRHYLAIWLIGNILLWGASLLYLIFKSPTYSSSWTIALPATASSTSINLPEIGQASSQNQSPFSNVASDPRENYKLLAVSNDVVSLAAENFQMTPEEFGNPAVKILDNTTLMELSIEGSTPEESQAKAVAVHQAFKKVLERLKKIESSEPDKNALEAVDNARTRLENARQELADYQESTGLNSNAQLENLANSIEQMRVEKAQLTTQQQRAQGKSKQLLRELKLSPKAAQDILSLHSDRLFGQYLENYSQAQTELVNLQAKFLPSHPTVIAQQEDVLSAETALLQRASSVLGRPINLVTLNQLGLKSDSNQNNSQKENLIKELIDLQGEEQGIREQAQELDRQIAQLEIRQKQRSRSGSQLDRLKKNVQIAEAVYSTALTQLEINQSNTANLYPPISLMTQPSLPTKPSSPKTILILLGSATGSFFLTVALLSLWQRDRRNYDFLFSNNGKVNNKTSFNSLDSFEITLKQ